MTLKSITKMESGLALNIVSILGRFYTISGYLQIREQLEKGQPNKRSTGLHQKLCALKECLRILENTIYGLEVPRDYDDLEPRVPNRYRWTIQPQNGLSSTSHPLRDEILTSMTELLDDIKVMLCQEEWSKPVTYEGDKELEGFLDPFLVRLGEQCEKLSVSIDIFHQRWIRILEWRHEPKTAASSTGKQREVDLDPLDTLLTQMGKLPVPNERDVFQGSHRVAEDWFQRLRGGTAMRIMQTLEDIRATGVTNAQARPPVPCYGTCGQANCGYTAENMAETQRRGSVDVRLTARCRSNFMLNSVLCLFILFGLLLMLAWWATGIPYNDLPRFLASPIVLILAIALVAFALSKCYVVHGRDTPPVYLP
ncbi:hypothetical protein QBC38DRAFT_498404 [Podospora fimiseda]|uniref:Uncharacterized protein n=1 Tax=Podospora fimiseda TaxID=252190 RepID=A0AAN7BT35_9PEZI|nr:hypothetical protein QBC38DRAFT_498404 [Podospora fimiseda]